MRRFGAPLLLLAFAACAKPVTHQDYDAVSIGMHRAEVDAALKDRLGEGTPYERSFKPGIAVPALWGTKDASLVVGFDDSDRVRLRVLKTPDSTASQIKNGPLD